MKIKGLPRFLTEELPLSEYHKDAEGSLTVWINPPPGEMLERYSRIYGYGQIIAIEMGIAQEHESTNQYLEKLLKLHRSKKEDERALYAAWLEKSETYVENEKDNEVTAWLSEILSKGTDKETHYSQEDLLAIIEATRENDPSFIDWIAVKARSMIEDYRSGRKKKSPRQ